jgi:hypothetical protein
MTMKREDILRWIEGHRAADAMADELRTAVMSPHDSFVAAMALWNLNPALFDAPEDPERIEGAEAARAAWARLRERLG